jgi:hypothetical protein
VCLSPFCRSWCTKAKEAKEEATVCVPFSAVLMLPLTARALPGCPSCGATDHFAKSSSKCPKNNKCAALSSLPADQTTRPQQIIAPAAIAPPATTAPAKRVAAELTHSKSATLSDKRNKTTNTPTALPVQLPELRKARNGGTEMVASMMNTTNSESDTPLLAKCSRPSDSSLLPCSDRSHRPRKASVRLAELE